jgi:hypothetical protein
VKVILVASCYVMNGVSHVGISSRKALLPFLGEANDPNILKGKEVEIYSRPCLPSAEWTRYSQRLGHRLGFPHFPIQSGCPMHGFCFHSAERYLRMHTAITLVLQAMTERNTGNECKKKTQLP